MPCNTVRLNTVELENVKDMGLLEKALRDQFKAVIRDSMSSTFYFETAGRWVTLRDGKLTSQLSTEQLQKVTGQVKQAYSRQVVQFAAQRFGWAIKKGADVNNFQLVKR